MRGCVVVEAVRGPLRIEDGGRARGLAAGVPPGGFADAAASRAANRLVGNVAHGPLLEVALTAPRLRFGADVTVAWTGAEMDVTIDGEPLPSWRRCQVRAGTILDGGGVVGEGLFGYLAVGGVWRVERWRGAVSALRPGTVAWPATSILAVGDALDITPVRARGEAFAPVTRPWWTPPIALAFAGAPESHWVDEVLAANYGLREELARTQWRLVRRHSDRMGFRLTGGPARFRPPVGLSTRKWSAAVVPGVVQWLPGGDLIVAGVDCQTVGGYGRVGWVRDYP